MNYQTQLTTLLEELLNQFEDDPQVGYLHYNDQDIPITVSQDLSELLDRANDLIYGQPDFEDGCLGGEGYPTEEEDVSLYIIQTPLPPPSPLRPHSRW